MCPVKGQVKIYLRITRAIKPIYNIREVAFSAQDWDILIFNFKFFLLFLLAFMDAQMDPVRLILGTLGLVLWSS